MEKGSIVMNITTEERFGIYKFLEVLEFPNIKQIESAHFSWNIMHSTSRFILQVY